MRYFRPLTPCLLFILVVLPMATNGAGHSANHSKDPSVEKGQEQDRASKEERGKGLRRVRLIIDDSTPRSLLSEILGLWYSDCQEASGVSRENSQSQALECLVKCAHESAGTATNPRASGIAPDTRRVGGTCNDRHCLSYIYSFGEKGDLKVHHISASRPEPSHNAEEGSPRETWEERMSQYDSCFSSRGCLVTRDGKEEPRNTPLYYGRTCLGCNGKYYTAIECKDGTLCGCVGPGCAEYDKEKSEEAARRSDDESSSNTETQDDIDTSDSESTNSEDSDEEEQDTDDPEEIDCSRMGGEEGSCGNYNPALAVALVQYYRQRAFQRKLETMKKTVVDPAPEGGERPTHFSTEIIDCSGREGHRLKPREDQNCKKIPVTFDDQAGSSCEDNTKSQLQNPSGKNRARRLPHSGAIDPPRPQ